SAVIGFIAVSKVSEESYYLHKFYMMQHLSGKGRGSEAFRLLLKLLQPKELKLTVNRMNYKSVNFYFKNGFKIEKPVTFDIGNGYVMDDFLMVWTV
ncbi:MAG: GNAT family N-acetyltransferase, partial [Bacteroidia bacterium]